MVGSIFAAVVVIVATATGVGMPGHIDGYFRHIPLAELRKHMDSAPVPTGAVLITEEAEEGSADRATTLTREYRTTPKSPACAQVVYAARAAGWEFIYAGRPIDPRTCATNHDVALGDLIPHATQAAPITVTWDGPRLFYSLTEGDMPL
jgi:hypothetical protein